MKLTKEFNLDSYKNLETMLKSSNQEDNNVAVECIKNLDLSELIIRFLTKSCVLNYTSRSKILNIIGEEPWGYKDLTFDELYPIAKAGSSVEKEIFKYLVNNIYQDQLSEYPYVESKIDIKW